MKFRKSLMLDPRKQSQRYRLRSLIEGKQTELVVHGLRHTRYLGEAKRNLQHLYLGAAVNLKRISTLAQTKGVDLRAILANLSKQQPITHSGGTMMSAMS
jgi:hypothetical protein